MAAAGRAKLEEALGYSFADPRRLAAALDRTHLERPAPAGRDGFERLEFLGDRVLGLVVAELLLRGFPAEPEGHIARRFAPLVSRRHLARTAQAIGLGAHVRLGSGESDGARAQEGLLADALEAVIGAVHQDGGLDAARAVVARLIDVGVGGAEPPRDAKMALQEWAQGRGHGLPVYRTIESSGPAHAPRFVVEVRVGAVEPATGTGPSKRAAEQEAAALALARATAP